MIRRPHGPAPPRPARSLCPPLSSPCFRDDRRSSVATRASSPGQRAIGHCRGLAAAQASRHDGGGDGGNGGAPPRPPRRTGGRNGDDDAGRGKKHSSSSLVPGTAAAVAFAALAGWVAWDALPTAGVDESALGARVSVVIPCLNESAAIEQTLALACGGGEGEGRGTPPSPLSQPRASCPPPHTFPALCPPPLEVIVVDGGSTDGTADLAERWARRHNREVERRRRRQQQEAEEEAERRGRRQQRGRRKTEGDGQGGGSDGGAGATEAAAAAAAARSSPPDPDSPPIALPLPPTVRVLRLGRRGRAVQMNAGAAAARGELLAFLHADTAPPPDLVAAARGWFRDRRNVALGFVPSIQVDDAWLEQRRRRRRTGQQQEEGGKSGGGSNGPGEPTNGDDAASALSAANNKSNRTHVLLAQSAHNTVKTLLYPALLRPASFARGLRLLFGDQVLVVRACDLRGAGGFDERYAIMEDADLCLRLHKQGPFHAGHSLCASFVPSVGAALGGGGSGEGGGNGSGSSGRSWGLFRGGRSREKEEKESAIDLGRWALQPSEAAFEPGPWSRPRGRVRMDCRRLARTSGRRLAASGFLRGSVTNFRIASAWYFSHSPRRVRELYKELYTDAYR